SSEWSLFKFLKFRQNEDTWTADKQKEHSTYITTLSKIARNGSSKQQPIAVSALDTFERDEANTKEVTEFWEDVEKEQNVKKLENVLEDLNNAFTVGRTLEHNNYINEDDFEPIEQITKKEQHRTRSGRKIPDYREMTSSSSEGDNNASFDHELPGIKEKTSSIRSTKRIKSNGQEQSVNEDKLQIPSGYSTPSPQSGPPEHSIPIESMEEPYMRLGNNIFEEDYYNNDIVIIDDMDELCFEDGDPADDYKLGETNVSQLFRRYQNESIKIAKTGGLFVESNVHEILSLSSIFLLTPGSHSNTMINIFSSTLLNKIHQQITPAQQIELDSECESKFRKVIKQAIKESRYNATKLLLAELSNNQTLNENLGSVILKGLEILPGDKLRNEPSEITLITNYLDYIMKSTFHDPDKHIVQWPNTALNESKSRKFEGRTKQPDFVVSIIHQFQTVAVVFVGEVSPPSQKNNVYKNCGDLIRLGVFMKDCMDFAIDKGADINVIGFQCVEILLGIQEIFKKSLGTLYDKFCNPSLPSAKAMFKRDTLSTPKFNHLVSRTRDCHRICPFWFGRF
ncbi:16678_t:CDS:2, partial [Acaulospora morrowiae]